MNIQQAFITGASSGIGQELTRLLAKQGIPVFITGRNKNALSFLSKELSPFSKVNFLAADLDNPFHLEELKKILSDLKPDLVINSAGFGLYGETTSYTVEEQMKILSVNIMALTEISLQSVSILKKAGRKGIIMNISSAAGCLIYPGFSLYSASKAYVSHFSQSLDAECKQYGIRILTCCPGQVHTSFRQHASLGQNQSKIDFKTLSVGKAAQLIMKQICNQKPFQIIDTRYKILIFIAKFLIPARRLEQKLKNEILKRITPK
ncbi:MAG: SDR family NAD(P)-dependent oxidoreductase [Chlamydiae bacterium]|nr:SDR family NAD(P)-dependent oxidoreductase [Chlamydiota bacterium]